jgi:TonB family protein
MTRFEKKCFIASAGTHVLLLSLLLLVPMLVTSKQPTINLPIIHFVPSKIVDDAMAGGGGSPPAQAVQPPVDPPPIQPTPKPEPKAPTPQPQKTPQPVVKPVSPTPVPTETPRKRWERIKPSLDRAKPQARRDIVPDARAQAERTRADYASRIHSAINAIGQGISSSTRIDIPGPGGAAFADYAQVVELIYRRAWSPPGEASDPTATVTVRVVIRRSGDVESFTVVRRSRQAALDSSVERLENIKFIKPFPEGARDEKRTFNISFNLNAS